VILRLIGYLLHLSLYFLPELPLVKRVNVLLLVIAVERFLTTKDWKFIVFLTTSCLQVRIVNNFCELKWNFFRLLSLSFSSHFSFSVELIGEYSRLKLSTIEVGPLQGFLAVTIVHGSSRKRPFSIKFA